MLRKQCHNFRWQETLNNIVVASQNSKFGNQDPPNLADNCFTCKLTEINKFRTPYTKFTIYWCDLLYISLTLLLLFFYFTTYNWRLQKVVKLSMKLTHEIHVALRWLDLKKKKKKIHTILYYNFITILMWHFVSGKKKIGLYKNNKRSD